MVAVAGPLVTSAYLGVAEAACGLATKKLAHKLEDPLVWQVVGEMETALATAQLATQSMVDLNADL
ncbi:MAG TPA: acyl-CoA dehydrogenase, partial [Chloroflexota bacterium]|nr:acyl-CoA dehydrogenase [Chloroflexota bacterium]